MFYNTIENGLNCYKSGNYKNNKREYHNETMKEYRNTERYKEWRKKYRDRFFSGGTDKDEDEEDFHSQPVKPKSFEDLFTVKE